MLNLVLLLKWFKIWCVYLPKFYIDFEKDGRDAGKDIALEVESSSQQTLTELCLMFVMMEEVLYQLLLISLDFI
jgi:hypothetical protein